MENSNNILDYKDGSPSKEVIAMAWEKKQTPEQMVFEMMATSTHRNCLLVDALTLCRVEDPITFFEDPTNNYDIKQVFHSSFTRAIISYHKHIEAVTEVDMTDRSAYSGLDGKAVSNLLQNHKYLYKYALAFFALHLSASLDRNGVESDRRVGNSAALSMLLLTEMGKYMRMSKASMLLTKELTVMPKMPL